MEIKIETNAELTDMFVRAHSFLNLPKSHRKKAKVPRPHYEEPWYRNIKTKNYGKVLPDLQCDDEERETQRWTAPNEVYVEHIVPLDLGGDNKSEGRFPNCIAMCHACNQARNSVVRVARKTNRVVSAVKFLIEQVYCKGVQLNKIHLSSYQRSFIQEKGKTPPVRQRDSNGKQNPPRLHPLLSPKQLTKFRFLTSSIALRFVHCMIPLTTSGEMKSTFANRTSIQRYMTPGSRKLMEPRVLNSGQKRRSSVG